MLASLRKFVNLLGAMHKYEWIFFFPHYGMGGAERVHISILRALNDRRKLVLFDQGSPEPHLLVQFADTNSECVVIGQYKSNKFKHILFLCLAYVAIRLKKKSIMFGCNNITFYRLKFFNVNRRVKFIDLVHTFDESIGFLRKSHDKMNKTCRLKKMDMRVFISETDRSRFENFYSNLPYSTSRVIYNCVTDLANSTKLANTFTTAFVGRPDNYQKRIDLFIRVANTLSRAADNSMKFQIIGFGRNDLQFPGSDVSALDGIEFKGSILDENELNKCYSAMNAIIITSRFEGFPMVVMEAMAHGVVPICTDVGGMREHILHGKNGFLVSNGADDEICATIENYITILRDDNERFIEMSKAAFSYAEKNFSFERFRTDYRLLLGA